MTHSKQLCSKLINLLLALAMILALMPAVSLTASAAGPKYVLTADTPQFSSDGWTWDGQTLHFFGSGTYEVNSDYFSIESTNNSGAAVIDISGALTVNFTAYTSTFIKSSCALDIKGAGKITVSAAYGYNRLFKSGGDITYAGGAICTDSELYLFANNLNSFTMTQGHIDAPNAYIEARSHTISNSYVAINSFNTANNYSDVINIDRSFVDTQTLLTTDKYRGLSITLNNSVLRSAADSSEFELDDNDIKKPQFSKVTNSVVYLTNVASVDGLKLSAALTSQIVQKAVDGGYVFCNQLITDKDLSGGNLDGGKNANLAKLSGAFYKSTTNTYMSVSNVTLTGGVLLSAPFDPNISNNAIATDATIVLLSEKDDPVMYVQKATDCTIVAINESASSNEISLQICENVDKCNVYSTATDGIIHAIYSNPNSYYFPKGRVKVYDDISDPDVSWFEGEGNITAESLEISKHSWLNKYIIRGNYCADSFKTDEDFTFDGSAKYSVNLNSFTGSGKLSLDGTAAFTCEKDVDTTWAPADFTSGYSGGSNTQLYIGRQVFNTLAEPNKTYNDDLLLCKGSSATINVPLTLPFNQWRFSDDFTLRDINNNIIISSLDKVGISAAYEDGSSNGSNSMNIILTAGNNVKAGSYELNYAMNRQAINKGNPINLTLSDYSSHVMDFFSTAADWSYTGSDGAQHTFTSTNYDSIIEADTWKWYGIEGDGYEAKTLVLKKGFSFSTINSNGIHFAEDATVVVEGSCAINAADSAISSAGNLTIKGDNDKSALTINKGLCSDKELKINGVKISTADITTISSAVNKALIQGNTVFLNNCEITAGDTWKDKTVIDATNRLTISRGVTLDLPASTIKASLICIAHIDNVENVLGTEVRGDAFYLGARSNPYGSDFGLITLTPGDSSKKMTLVTMPFEVSGDLSDIVIEDEFFGTGGKTLFGGEKYKVELPRIGDIGKLSISPAEENGYKFSISQEDDTAYLIVEVPNNNINSPIKPTITIADDQGDYSSQETISFTPTIGKAVRASKMGILHSGNYGDLKPTECYKITALDNGTNVPLRSGDECDYFVFPASDKINVTIIPEENHMFKNVLIKAWGAGDDNGIYIGPLPTGDYNFGEKGAVSIQQLCLDLDVTTGTQYKTVAISNDLIQSLTNDEIEAITLTYRDGKEKTFDKTNHLPKYVLSNTDVTVSITAPDKFVADINGVKPSYNNGVYSIKLADISDDIDITATLEDFTGLGEFTISAPDITGAGDNVTILTPPATAQGHYKAGTECEIVVKSTENKFIDTVTFNGTEIEADSTDSDGSHYKVTVVASVSRFDVTYTDCAQLTIAKPANGTIEFTGRLDGGRSKETPADGTQIISIGAGDEVTLTVTPDAGYRVKSATLNGKEVTLTDGKYTFTIEAGTEFSVEFEKIPPENASVTVKCGEHGTVSPATSDYPIGTEVTLTVTPDSGYRVKSATMDGKAVTLTDGKYTFTLPANCEFGVEFEEIPAANASVTVKCGEHGTVSPATSDYPIGTEVTLTVTPDSGYRVKSATLDGKAVSLTDGKYTFTLTADCEFSVEFEEIPAGSATVTVKCGANGTVTPSTSEYPIGTEVTLTVTPDKGYQVKSAALDGKDVKLTDGKYTFTLTADCEFSVEFQKKPTGGSSSGGHSYTGSGSTGNRESVPALNGESRSWNEISSDLSKMDENSRADVYMNGSTSIPSAVLKEIKDKKISVVFRFDSNKSWTVDGSMITSDYASADLYLLPGTSTEKGARGSAGYRFSTGGNDVEARLNVQFKNEHAGKFANLYFIKDGRAEFVSTAKIAENGCVTLPGAAAKGEYVIMLCDYSDLLGDANNDGVVNALDVAAILKDIVEIARCANPQMGDYNTSGRMNALDAAEILKRIVR